MVHPSRTFILKRKHGIRLTDDEFNELKRLTRKTGFTYAVRKAIEILRNKEVQSIAFPAYSYDESGNKIPVD